MQVSFLRLNCCSLNWGYRIYITSHSTYRPWLNEPKYLATSHILWPWLWINLESPKCSPLGSLENRTLWNYSLFTYSKLSCNQYLSQKLAPVTHNMLHITHTLATKAQDAKYCAAGNLINHVRTGQGKRLHILQWPGSLKSVLEPQAGKSWE